MNPAFLSVLIHCHAVAEPLQGSPVHRDAVMFFLNNGIIAVDDRDGSGYATTERGRRWLEMILETPMPVQIWTDPRVK